MLGTRHQAAIAQSMEQSIHTVEVKQLAELLFQDAPNIFPAKRANFIRLARRGIEARTKPISFFQRKLLPSPLSGPTTQSFHAGLVVATYPHLNRSP